jgi:Bacterial PH domain
MNRSRDLDTIAPDDPIIENTVPTNILIEEPPKEFPKANHPKKEKRLKQNQKIYDILGHTTSSFSSFLVDPKVFDFTERQDQETIILAVRPHWIVNLKWILITIFMLFVPNIVDMLDTLNSLPTGYQFVAHLFWFLFTFIYAFEKFLDWYFDVFIVTNKRLVDIKFNNLINKHFAEADMDVIQDVSSSVRGIFGTFFNFGTVLVQTASEINQIIFKNVPNPEKIIKAIQELRNTPDKGGDEV